MKRNKIISITGFENSIAPKFRPYLNDNTRISVYWGGAGSGKSYFVSQKLVYKALNDKRKILCLRRYGVDLKGSCWEEILNRLTDLGVYDLCTINKANMTIELPNGSIFLFKGLDEGAERLKSISGISDCWIEEANQITRDMFLQINLRIRGKQKHQQLILTYNPVSRQNWVYKEFHEEEITEYLVIHSTYKDNPFLNKEYIEQLEKAINTDKRYYRIYSLGEFCSLDQAIFNNWEVKEFTKEEILFQEFHQFCSKSGLNPNDFLFPQNNPLYHRYFNMVPCNGIDLGWTDETAFICTLVNPKTKEIYIYDDFQSKYLKYEDIKKVIEEKHQQKATWICDCNEPRVLQEVRKAVPRVRGAYKRNGSVMESIRLIQGYKIYVHPNCSHSIAMLENYSFEKDRTSGEYIERPKHDKYSHMGDAFRYSMQCVIARVRAGNRI